MKHKFFSLSVVAIALIMSSCSNDIDEGQTPGVNSGGQVITFKPWANKQTKAGTIKADDMTDFAVLATDTAAAEVLIDGAVVVGSNATSWTYTPAAFWPETATVNFFAYAPTDAQGVTGGATALVGQSDDPLTGTPVIEYELPTVLSEQKDLLVSRHSGAYSQDGTSGVRLNFRHALSRVLFQAKSESATEFEVLSIRLMNLKGKATLDLNKVPKDATAFPYPKNNAEIASPGYQIFWEPDGITNIDTLEATLTTPDVPGDGDWHYVVGDADALYVIPQINAASLMDSATVVDATNPDPAPGEFYIEISFQEKVAAGQPAPAPKTYAVPIPAIVGDAYASSIAFEMERQYTFQFELFGRKTIEFKGVTVSNYSNVVQEEPLRVHWAGSNIYYDATLGHLTFDDDSVKTNEKFQGVLFKWGSLTGISPVSNYNTGSTVVYQKGGAAANGPAWGAIPYINADPGTPYDLDVKYLTETAAHDTINGVGDICKYLTEKGWAPKGKRWRMPTAAEFGARADYTATGSLGGMSTSNTEGKGVISSGYRYNGVFFPASGFRLNSNGSMGYVGSNGYYWSSSPGSNTEGFHLYFNTTILNPASVGKVKASGLSVRCVVQ